VFLECSKSKLAETAFVNRHSVAGLAPLRLLWRIVLRPRRPETGGNKRLLRCCGSTDYPGNLSVALNTAEVLLSRCSPAELARAGI
jgi:hypothetical protein